MNPAENALLATIFAVMDEALRAIVGDGATGYAGAILAGNPTDEQLSTFTNVVHGEFDAHDGCMITAIKELTEVGVPHYALNHVIRTYVRLCDKREQEAAEQHSEKAAAAGGPFGHGL